jgi:hypothetical protein
MILQDVQDQLKTGIQTFLRYKPPSNLKMNNPRRRNFFWFCVGLQKLSNLFIKILSAKGLYLRSRRGYLRLSRSQPATGLNLTAHESIKITKEIMKA